MLNAAGTVTRWSTSGDAGQRVLSRKDPGVSGLVAAALALHGLTLPPPNTGWWVMFFCEPDRQASTCPPASTAAT